MTLEQLVLNSNPITGENKTKVNEHTNGTLGKITGDAEGGEDEEESENDDLPLGNSTEGIPAENVAAKKKNKKKKKKTVKSNIYQCI